MSKWNIDLPVADWYPVGDERIDGLVREVRDQDVLAIDTETTGLNRWSAYPLYWSMAWGNRRVCMPTVTISYFQEAFKDPGVRWVFANAKFDMHMFANALGYNGEEAAQQELYEPFAGEIVDTAVMHALLYEESSHALKDMAQDVLGWRWSDFFDTFKPNIITDFTQSYVDGRGKTKYPKRKEHTGEMLTRFEIENLPVLIDYASNDAFGTLRLYEALKKQLEGERLNTLYPEWLPTMAHLFFLTEAPFTKILWHCERNGVYVDRDYLQKLSVPMERELTALKRRMIAISGDRGFNPNSDDQVRHYFFDISGLAATKWTKGGKTSVKKASVDKSFLEHYELCEDKEGHVTPAGEMAHLMLDYAKLEKLLSTYIRNVDEHLDHNGRMHTKFNQDVARTGRLSSSDPNLQNVPTPDKDKYKLRGAFRPQKDSKNTLIVGDYEQLEMRLLACATVTPAMPEGARDMIQIFLDGKDIHMGSAEIVYGKIYERRHGFRLTYDLLKSAKKIDGQVKEGKLPETARTEQVALAVFARTAIKVTSFGLNYGMAKKKLARSLNISEIEAEDIINRYFAAYPAVKNFYDAAKEEARQTGFSSTILGRRRRHTAINSLNTMDRWSEERKAVNNNIQGSAADCVRLAMLNIWNSGVLKKYRIKMLLQVHDELMFECNEEVAPQAMIEIKQIMEHPFPTELIVPLTISIGKGQDWAHAK